MKISYAEYIKKTDVSVLIAEAIFSELQEKATIKTIADIADTSSGGTPLRSNFEYYGGDIAWLKSGELNDGIIEKAEEFITEKGLANSSAKLLPENTLLLAMYGATAGRTGITKIQASTNQAVCALFPKDDVSQEFLFWFLRQHRHKFIEISKGGAQPNISQTVINSTLIPVPDKKLQKQVTDILQKIEKEGVLDISIIPREFQAKVKSVFATKNNVFEIDSELTHQLSLVKKLRQQLLQDAVQGKLVAQNKNDEPASELLKKIKAEKEKLIAEKKLKKEKELPPIKPEEIPFEIPENWVWCRLGDIYLYSESGKSFKCTEVPISGNEWGVIKVSAISWDNFLEEKNKLYSKDEPENTIAKIELGDFIISRANTSELVGKSVVVKNISKNLLLSDKTIRFKFSDLVSTEYVNLCNNNIYARLYYATMGTGSSPSMKNITREHMNNLTIPLPPQKEQNIIVQKLIHLIQNCDALEESIKQSVAQNEKLLQQVLREALQSK